MFPKSALHISTTLSQYVPVSFHYSKDSQYFPTCSLVKNGNRNYSKNKTSLCENLMSLFLVDCPLMSIATFDDTRGYIQLFHHVKFCFCQHIPVRSNMCFIFSHIMFVRSKLVGGLKHVVFLHISEVIIPID